jgi:hypothetical protein
LLLGVACAAIAAVNGLDLPLTARRLKLLASAISALILGYPALHPSLAALAAVLTAAKFALYALAAGTAVAGLSMAWRPADTRDHASGRSTS